MNSLLDKLPTILVLFVLVGIFLSLRKHAPSARVRLWTYAWALIFLHFFIQAFEAHTGTLENILESIDIGSLELSGVVFAISMTLAVEDRKKRWIMLAVLAVPTAFQAVAAVFDWHVYGLMTLALGTIFFGGIAFALRSFPHPKPYAVGIAVILAITGIWAMHDQLHGSADLGMNAILTLSFALCGILYWKRFPRPSPGVITVTGGFVAWGAVFPAGALLAQYAPKLQVNPELWNVPKFFVAFGMILALIEDKSGVIERSNERERAANRLLLQLSQITSRLLAGSDPADLCGEITAAVTGATSFPRAALFLARDDRSLRLGGCTGFSPAEKLRFEERSKAWTIEKVKDLCKQGTQLGNNSFLIRSTEADAGARSVGAAAGAAAAEHEVLVPLVSWRGSHLGCLCLSAAGTTEESAVNETAEIMKLEVLASDLAVTIENSRLHHQLVRSEKLAALGQLVAGVAHELNNPLTGIMGYADLLSEEVEGQKAAKRVEKLGAEARRMKRIVDGLLRFARQNNPAARAADFATALHDVIQLREFHIRKLGIKMDVHVEPDLPRISIGEDELKQVLLNILNNAIDAVEESAQRSVSISATRQGDRVFIRFDDSGPGFSDLNRAFDPFFATKPVGKGTGLGLSICYGIIQEAGGEIVLHNKQPFGASISLEFPATVTEAAVILSA
ncbi:MAG: ATP-binding protein [Candidatus Acidiferrales bacterium]